jgi:hypothetical protein
MNQMSTDWKRLWNAVQIDFRRLQDEMQAMEEVLTSPAASSWDRAGALTGVSASLCRFLALCRDQGVFEDIADDALAISADKDALLGNIATVLRQEETVLKEGGFEAHKAAALMQDVESIMAGQWHVEPLAKVAWMRHVEAAIGDICHFPKSEILVLAKDFGNWVADVYKTYNIATGVIIAGANAVFAAQIPEPFTATKFSKLIAFLFIGASVAGSGEHSS